MNPKITQYLETLDRSANTVKSYRNACTAFTNVTDGELTMDNFVVFLRSIKHLSPATKNQYKTAVIKLYEYHKAADPFELRSIAKHYIRSAKTPLPIFDRDAIEKVISYCDGLRKDLIDLRDRAFILTLSDTGLRLSEACSLKRGDVDWREQRAFIVGKGAKPAKVMFSNRSTEALKLYLSERANVEPDSRKPLASQPLFARHDISASKTVKPIKPSGMWKAIKSRFREAGVEDGVIRIHDFRHYFVTVVYMAEKNIKLAQELARHESIMTTNRYAHMLDDAEEKYDQIFNKR